MLHDPNRLISEIRRFNRFYTRTIGLLDETLTRSAFTLSEARVLFELGHRNAPAMAEAGNDADLLFQASYLNAGPTASEIATELRLDPAYLARILSKFAGAGLIAAQPDSKDGRRRILSLTAKGRAVLSDLQAVADGDMTSLVGGLSAPQRRALADAMQTIMGLLGGTVAEASRIALRPHRPGDVGWVVQRQSVLYAEEYGWDITFEALLAEIGAAFIRNFREGRDFCWIAERGGEPVGAAFLVHDDDETAKLRMLHVEASARGLGIGKLLVAACIEKARACGYRRMVLWTNDVLVAACAIYEKAGFHLVGTEKHHSFGKDLVGQTWQLEL